MSTQQDLISAFGSNSVEDGAVTVQELAKATGYSKSKCNRIIQTGIDEGSIKFAGNKQVLNVIGNRAPRPSYKLVKK